MLDLVCDVVGQVPHGHTRKELGNFIGSGRGIMRGDLATGRKLSDKEYR